MNDPLYAIVHIAVGVFLGGALLLVAVALIVEHNNGR